MIGAYRLQGHVGKLKEYTGENARQSGWEAWQIKMKSKLEETQGESIGMAFPCIVAVVL